MNTLSSTQTSAQAPTQARQAMYARRKRTNRIALALSLAAMAFGVFWLVWILWETVRLGVGGLSYAGAYRRLAAAVQRGQA